MEDLTPAALSRERRRSYLPSLLLAGPVYVTLAWLLFLLIGRDPETMRHRTLNDAVLLAVFGGPLAIGLLRSLLAPRVRHHRS